MDYYGTPEYRPIVSVVIPAHNESSSIEGTLSALLGDMRPGEFDVVVACNGCTDDTAERARGFDGVRVIEVDEASKIAALNAGDAATSFFPRVYIDADVTVDTDAIRRTAAALTNGEALAASPAIRVDTAGSSWPVRAFYRVWLRRGYHTRNPLGAGFYALSAEGRRRFGDFPRLIADDEFVRRQFTEAERLSVPVTAFTIRAPRRVRDLIKVKTRSRLGRYELRQRFPDLFRRGESEAKSSGVVLWPPSRGIEQAVYYLIAAATVWRARRQFARLAEYAWERDESSRTRPASA